MVGFGGRKGRARCNTIILSIFLFSWKNLEDVTVVCKLCFQESVLEA